MESGIHFVSAAEADFACGRHRIARPIVGMTGWRVSMSKEAWTDARKIHKDWDLRFITDYTNEANVKGISEVIQRPIPVFHL